jgi:hypothetical protein
MMFLAAAGVLGAVGCATDAADESTGSVSQKTGSGPFDNCHNQARNVGLIVVNDVLCQGTVSILPINVNVKDVDVLSNNDLDILNNDLNHVSILDGGILNNNKILNDVVDVTKNDFLNKFNVTGIDGQVCAVVSILGLSICK